MVQSDYPLVKASRSPELTRRIASHEIGHAFLARALGSAVEFVTLIPHGAFAGRCVRRGAPSSASLALFDEHAVTHDDVPAKEEMTSSQLADVCAKIGAPPIGAPRIEFAEELERARVMVTELVAATVCERVLYPDLPDLGAHHDYAEARALASVVCSTAYSVEALLAFSEAEAEGLIRAHMGVVQATRWWSRARCLAIRSIKSLSKRLPKRAWRSSVRIVYAAHCKSRMLEIFRRRLNDGPLKKHPTIE